MTCSKSSQKRSRSQKRRNRVLRVALTGGIACGKSVVARLLAEKGCLLYSADQAAHELMRPGRPAWKKVVARFGPGILRPDRTIDRSVLGTLVFGDAAARRALDRIVHPLVLADQDKAVRRLERRGRAAIFVVEAALTIEAGYARHFDRVVVVHCRKADQVRRLRERDGIGRAAALRRIGSQMPVREKLRYADYAVDTSGTLAETVERTERLFAELSRDAELKI
ncbi:MAG: dephospho-CoA kinase [Acidobacteriota bacterium]